MPQYIPKSKLKIQITSGDEFIYKLTKKPYIGSYIETSNNKFYAGGNPQDLSTPLIPSVEPTNVQFGYHPDVVKYKKIKVKPFDILKLTKPVVSARNIPKDEDYSTGYFPRFFAKKHNMDNNYIEIDGETFLKLKTKTTEYDYRLYKVGVIEWSLKGDVERSNRIQLKRLEKKFPLLYTLFPVLNEFQASTDKIIMNTQSPTFSYQYGGQEESITTNVLYSGGGGGGY